MFSQSYGLCANLFDYLTLIGAPCEEALEQLHADFRSAGLNEALPFNESNGHYYEEKGNNMCHMNPARVVWVRAQMAQVAPDGVVKVALEKGMKRYGDAMLNLASKESVMPSDSVGELTMLVKQLAWHLKKAKPECKLPEKAMDYLKRNELISTEDVLR
ncbi:prophage protein [Escherichia coli]|uniref:hypothetical protein n=1 Tax=Escherichia coli TaxID=562 RepID=UPI0019BBC605|nr:hypothetical protein [Escherichia coli]CAD6115560.1 prophage protein [Escherichia coli]